MNRTNSALSSPLEHTATGETLGGTLLGKAGLAIGATALVAVAAHVSMPLPFSPVPLTLQPFAVLLIGMILGPATAFSAMVLYLAEGAAGMPVFTPQGPGGVAQLLGPTAGFLFSYPFAAAAAGWLVRLGTWTPTLRALAAGVGTTAIIYTFGAGWLATLLHLNANAAWHLAIAPFIPGEIVKIVAAAVLYNATRRWQQS